MSEPENNSLQIEGAGPSQLSPSSRGSMQTVTPRPIFMPETFTGAGREWTDWAEQFEIAADVNNWDEPLRLKFMGLLLSGRAREVYSGLSTAAKTNYVSLKQAMGRCLDPCDSDDWNRATFSSRRRLHNETVREFGIALRRLVVKAYPSADIHTQDLLAKDHFVTHVGNGDLRVSLRSAKPATLEDAINLAAELELIRGLERGCTVADAKVRGVGEKPDGGERVDALLAVVEGLRQEVKSLQTTVQALADPSKPSRAPSSSGWNPSPFATKTSSLAPRREVDPKGGCWECGCNRHLRRDCPYLQGN